jgi:hypothetical protein
VTKEMKEMENNYLWDRSGEPDPEIQKLEEILGTLRYQPQPLEIPHHVQIGRRRSFFPALAIAAAIALCAVLLGLWLGFHRPEVTPPMQASESPTEEKNAKTPPPQVGDDRPGPQSVATVVKSPNVPNRRRESPRNLLVQNQNRATKIRRPALTPEELAEKEQVLVALRLVSAKLNLAQRKTQGVPQLNTIRNQHKIG